MPANADKIASIALQPVQPTRLKADIDTQTRRDNPEGQTAPDYRLIIEEGPGTGTFIYKTVDRATGQVVNQWPREALIKLRDDPGYEAGSVVTTKA